ncbi:MAG: hypothetical protein KAS87_05780 [Candidatus Omnitrophica bacterium]|nr:hypothetical protein [Candidatus Omnitrophota bacterium]
MRTKEFLIRIANLFLQSEKASADWVNVPILRRCWYVLCVVLLGVFSINLIILNSALYDILAKSVGATMFYRTAMAIIYLLLSFFMITYSFFYYRYVVSTQKKLYLQNIIFFYISSIFIFGLSYGWLYYINQKLFIYQNPPVVISPLFMRYPWSLKIDFILFSAFNSLSGNFFKIQCGTTFVSLLSYIQSLYTYILIALFVASHVSQRKNNT